MKTKYKVLLAIVIVVLGGLIGFLVYWNQAGCENLGDMTDEVAIRNGKIYEIIEKPQSSESIKSFCESEPDRRFLRDLYPYFGSFSPILDIGTQSYNRPCKDFISSPSSLYYQLEPSPLNNMVNDGFLHSTVEDSMLLYPQYEGFFELINDFGVVGCKAGEAIDIPLYMLNIRRLLKDGGVYVLKISGPNYTNTKIDMESHIEPYFDRIDFGPYHRGGHPIDGYDKDHKFYDQKIYFYRKKLKLELMRAIRSTPKRYLQGDVELDEQLMVLKFLPRDARVLELGGRTGVVSKAINLVLDDKTQHLVVEPSQDPRIIENLRKLGRSLGFKILNGAIGKYPILYDGYFSEKSGKLDESKASRIPVYTLDQVQLQYGIHFTAIVADCEGCLPQVLEDFPQLLDQVSHINIEYDMSPGVSESLRSKISEAGFRVIARASGWGDSTMNLLDGTGFEVWEKMKRDSHYLERPG